LNHGNQILSREGLPENGHAGRHVRRVCDASRHQYAGCPRREPGNFTHKLCAPHFGHLDIGYDKINTRRNCDDLQSSTWPLYRKSLITLPVQHPDNGTEHGMVVIDYQNPRSGHSTPPQYIIPSYVPPKIKSRVSVGASCQ
jgi:hypothetical protein